MAATIKKLPALPAERALKVISGRWKAVILYHLFSGKKAALGAGTVGA
jgi:DNA-binding HxlR family transcriptional regulator